MKIQHGSRTASLCILLAVLTVAVFWRAQTFEFIRYDDPLYVVDNVHVRSGIDLADVRWAFTTGESASWQPVTWISLMIDAEAFGVNARAFHLTNLALHTINVLLVFLLMQRMTGQAWQSAFVAALFAIHPLRVEPVAWISERKGLLSLFFGLLSLAAYISYVRAGGRRWLVLSLAAFSCSLMSKQMLVTFPFLLLLLDYWPLKRLRLRTDEALVDRLSAEPTASETRTPRELLLEKIPYFLLTVAFSISAYWMQQRAGAVSTLSEISPLVRLTNATVGFGIYLAKTFWPTGLSVYYPHWRDSPPLAQFVAAALVLMAVSALAIQQRTRRPYLLVGWLWYLGSLVPVIGLVQIGAARWAIRYTYVPLLGIFFAVTWLVDSLLPSRGWQRILKWTIALAAIAACAVVSSRELDHWRNSATLFTHALEVTGENTVALSNAGNALLQQGQHDQAVELLERAVQFNPNDFESRLNYGEALCKLKRWDDATAEYQAALKFEPESAVARNHLGDVHFARGQYDAAEQQYRDAIHVNSDFGLSYNNLGNVFKARGEIERAIEQYERAIAVDPDIDAAYDNLGLALVSRGRLDKAIEMFRQAVRVQPNNVSAHVHLGEALQSAGRADEAAHSFRAALDIDPSSEPARRGLEQIERAQ